VSEQVSLLDWVPPATDRHGGTFSHAFDYERLNRQARVIYDLMRDGKARSLREISAETGEPEASISARLREYNQPVFSSAFIRMEKRRRPGLSRGTWEYWLVIG
jgi:hypothetical protein